MYEMIISTALKYASLKFSTQLCRHLDIGLNGVFLSLI